MAPQQDSIQVERVDDSTKNPIVVVNGKEVIVSSATEKPNRSLWVAWLYIFDVSLPLGSRNGFR
jgi:dTDP-glucose pyrophosphorylase